MTFHTLPLSQTVRNSALSMPHPLRGLGRLAQSEVEALFQTFIEKYDLLPNPPQSCPSVPEGVPPPGEQNAVQRSSSSPLSEQPPPDYPLATASRIPRYKHSNSCFTRGMARLKTWIRCRSAFNARQSPNASLSATTPPRIALGRGPALENDRDGPSPTLPPSQLVNNSETPLIILHPPPAIGRHTQSEVEPVPLQSLMLLLTRPRNLPLFSSQPTPAGANNIATNDSRPGRQCGYLERSGPVTPISGYAGRPMLHVKANISRPVERNSTIPSHMAFKLS